MEESFKRNINEPQIYSVSQLTASIKRILENEFPPVWIEGEISNFRRPASGHLYFTLKDEKTQIQVIMYRSYAQKLAFKLEDGMKVLIYGNVTVYERAGQYQVNSIKIEPKGIGALQLAFEQLKKKLLREGLFDKQHKKTIPVLPNRIGVITSPTGAAIRDILNVLDRRFSNINLIVNPVRVQGEQAPPEISFAIDEFNRLNLVDVILVTRGGGSIEDLWAFNTEIVARSIFNSNIPVISAVGHEIDWTISDYAADLRVPTPSAAAELVVASKEEFLNKILNIENILNLRINQCLTQLKNKVENLSNSWVFTQPLSRIRQCQQQIDDLELRLKKGLKYRLQILNHSLTLYTEKLHAYSPTRSLLRGYTITVDPQNRETIKSVKEIVPGQRLKIFFSDGDVSATADRVCVKKKYK
ncbi:exodeoxyribonuclease VII large subunit [bacterium]|nr:exodeoxyribonuclease VII large subunit [bacterium]